MKLRPWTLLFAGAAACVAACVFLIWRITVTGDTSIEWVVWVLVLAGFGLFAGGYLSESGHRREHPEEYEPEWPES